MSRSEAPLNPLDAQSGSLHPKPSWFKVRPPAGETYARVKRTLAQLHLSTVCQEARCPNLGECWGSGTATFLLLGPTCTRGCRFCQVRTGSPSNARPEEPEQVARAVDALGLRYVVLTMVTRDDLPDGGASQVARTVELVNRTGALVEVLVGDFAGCSEDVAAVLAAKPVVFSHNLEVTRRLTPRVRHRRSSYSTSLAVLQQARLHGGAQFIKSSLMVGLGEADPEVHEALRDLRLVGTDIVTLGQYSRPSLAHAPVERWVVPAQFELFAQAAEQLDFAFVASGPLVRSSYRAAEAFVTAQTHSARRPGALADDRSLSQPAP
ncbi:lipoyl synthase [Myxococcota bacterium]